jgi:curved DNA-binding protein CbpA
MPREEDYFKVLGLRSNASLQEVTTAYEALAAKWYPLNVHENPEFAHEMYRRVCEAYQALKALLLPGQRQPPSSASASSSHDDRLDDCAKPVVVRRPSLVMQRGTEGGDGEGRLRSRKRPTSAPVCASKKEDALDQPQSADHKQNSNFSIFEALYSQWEAQMRTTLCLR